MDEVWQLNHNYSARSFLSLEGWSRIIWRTQSSPKTWPQPVVSALTTSVTSGTWVAFDTHLSHLFLFIPHVNDVAGNTRLWLYGPSLFFAPFSLCFSKEQHLFLFVGFVTSHVPFPIFLSFQETINAPLMNHIAETTKSTIGIIQAHALLAKALSNDSKPTPGYLFPEIARNETTNARTFVCCCWSRG